MILSNYQKKRQIKGKSKKEVQSNGNINLNPKKKSLKRVYIDRTMNWKKKSLNVNEGDDFI